MNMKKISAISQEGYNYRYSFNGSKIGKPTIVFVGGAFQQIEGINKPFKLWSDDFNYLIIELPGFGLSDHLPDSFGMDFYVDCIGSAIRDCQLSSNLVAYSYSYGAGPLFRYVSQNEHMFSSFIIGGASTDFSSQMIQDVEKMIALCRSVQKDEFKQAFLDTFISDQLAPKTKKRTQVLIKGMLRRICDQDLTNFAHNYHRMMKEKVAPGRINIPSMVIYGGLDKFTQESSFLSLDNMFEDVTLARLDDCDHFYYMQSETSLSLVNEFATKHNVFNDFPIPVDYTNNVIDSHQLI